MSLRDRWGFGPSAPKSGGGSFSIPGLPSSVTAGPKKAASGGWNWLFTPQGMGMIAVCFAIWAIQSGRAKEWTGQFIVAALAFVPTLAVAVGIVLLTSVLIGAGMWAIFHRQHLGEHGFHMGWKAAVGALVCVGLLPLMAFGVGKMQANTAALTQSYFGQAPSANLCQSAPSKPTGAIVAPTPRQP